MDQLASLAAVHGDHLRVYARDSSGDGKEVEQILPDVECHNGRETEFVFISTNPA